MSEQLFLRTPLEFSFYRYVLKKSHTEKVVRRCSIKKVFLKISQISQENTCIKKENKKHRKTTLLKKSLWHRCFPLNFAKFLRIPFFYRSAVVAASGHTKKNHKIQGKNRHGVKNSSSNCFLIILRVFWIFKVAVL